jgi:biopolymer transport protein ExbD
MRMNMDDGDDITVDMGPLIDCVFLLLIFFLVSTTMKKPEQEIPINLPDPGLSAESMPSAQAQNVVIDNQGVFYWGGTPIGQRELHEKVKTFGTDTPEVHLRIRVDRDAPSRYLVQLLDLCAFEGLSNYAIHTQDGKVPKKITAPKKS